MNASRAEAHPASAESPHPEEARRAVSKDGPQTRCRLPILRDAALRAAPQDEAGRLHRFGIRLSFAVVAAVLVAATAAAQAPTFDDRPTRFLTAQNGGMPADAWNRTPPAPAQPLGSAS